MRIRIPTKFRIDKDMLACLGLFLFLIQKPLLSVVIDILHARQIINIWVTIVVIYLPVILMPFVPGKRKNILPFLAVWVFALLSCMVTYMFHPEYEHWLFEGDFNIWLFIFMPDNAIYLMLLVLLVDDPDKIFKTLKMAGFVLLAYNLAKLVVAEFIRGYWVGTGVNRGSHGEYNLGFGYDVLMLFVLFSIIGKQEKNKWYYALSAVALVCILVAGSRGPLVGVALVVMVHITDWIRDRSALQRFILTASAAIILIFLIMYMDLIMMGLGHLLQSMGVSSRTVTMLASGNYSSDNGRARLYEIAIELIKSGGPFGNGVYGDRYEIARKTTMWIGYCHNVLLEILVDYGYLMGSILVILLVSRMVKILRAPESQWRSLYLIFLITSSQLILSGSFWYLSFFWGFIGVDVCWSRRYGSKKRRALALK